MKPVKVQRVRFQPHQDGPGLDAAGGYAASQQTHDIEYHPALRNFRLYHRATRKVCFIPESRVMVWFPEPEPEAA